MRSLAVLGGNQRFLSSRQAVPICGQMPPVALLFACNRFVKMNIPGLRFPSHVLRAHRRLDQGLACGGSSALVLSVCMWRCRSSLHHSGRAAAMIVRKNKTDGYDWLGPAILIRLSLRNSKGRSGRQGNLQPVIATVPEKLQNTKKATEKEACRLWYFKFSGRWGYYDF